MSKRVYKFTKADHAIGSLQSRRLKLSTIDDLNDPFDQYSVDVTDPAIETATQNYIIHFRSTKGMLCFSRNWDNLLLWSHYGDSHKGICLGFDIPEGTVGANYDTDVLYQPNVIQIHNSEELTYDLVNRLLRTKHESWSYEQEVRMFVELKNPPDSKGLRWSDFGPLLELREVIIGAQADPNVSNAVRAALEPYGDAVACRWAGMRKDAFLLVKLEHPPDWQVAAE